LFVPIEGHKKPYFIYCIKKGAYLQVGGKYIRTPGEAGWQGNQKAATWAGQL